MASAHPQTELRMSYIWNTRISDFHKWQFKNTYFEKDNSQTDN